MWRTTWIDTILWRHIFKRNKKIVNNINFQFSIKIQILNTADKSFSQYLKADDEHFFHVGALKIFMYTKLKSLFKI